MPSLEEDTQRLRALGGYEWLLDGPEFFSASEVEEKLNASGVRVGRETISRWFRDLPDTQNFGKVGLYASRKSLIAFFASRLMQRGKAVGDDE